MLKVCSMLKVCKQMSCMSLSDLTLAMMVRQDSPLTPVLMIPPVRQTQLSVRALNFVLTLFGRTAAMQPVLSRF